MVGSRALAVRVVVSAVVAAGLQIGPVVHQVLGLPLPPPLMGWTMYSGVGRDLCTVRWSGGGQRLPGADRHLRSPEAVRAAVDELCGQFGDVRADAWCPAPDGRWVRAVDPEERLCR